ncbi:23S rRNA (guanosine(2251)-2'-O)-methyltransferase RlmB [bacterium]|nr:23S rRNA (guanosine(2251)-2'-O)-methyltransferase RlmB [candidate division CSSED10-310 bacterium]
MGERGGGGAVNDRRRHPSRPSRGSRGRPGGAPVGAGGGDLLYGPHAVIAALENPGRRIQCVLRVEGAGEPPAALIEAARRRGVEIRKVARRELDAMAPGATHQGVALLAGPLPVMDRRMLLSRLGKIPEALVLALDCIQDPRNLGAIIRTAEAVGVAAAIVQSDRTSPLDGAAAKTASGSLERVPVARVSNLRSMLLELKKGGFWVGALEMGGSVNPFKFERPERFVLVVGAEGRGVGRLIRGECDYLFGLPMMGRVESLNAGVAAGIALYALMHCGAAD